MNLKLLPDGRPGEHLGLSHTLKHYLQPREMWEDVSEEVEPRFRPRAAAAGLPQVAPPAWEQWEEPGPELSAAWDALRPVYRRGYGKLLTTLAAPLSEPGAPEDSGWRRRGGLLACTPGRGVLLVMHRRTEGWQLHSAFRPMDFKLRRHECPPMDATSVSLRRRLAEFAAVRRLASWRGQDDES